MKYPFLTPEKIETAADRLRQCIADRISSDRPLDLDAVIYDHLCETEDLIFDDGQSLPHENGEEVLGKFFPVRGKILIHAPLKLDHRPGRYRFTVAHELGHWVLHRPLFLADAQQGSLFDVRAETELTSLNRSVFPVSTDVQIAQEEWQANQFASYLLVPRTDLVKAFTTRFGAPPAPLRDGRVSTFPTKRLLARDLATRSVRRKLPLHEQFGVSIEAMAVTLLQRELVVDE